MKNCILITKQPIDHQAVYDLVKKASPNSAHTENYIDLWKQPNNIIIELPSLKLIDDEFIADDVSDKDEYISEEYIYFSPATYRLDETLIKFAKIIVMKYPDMIILDEDGNYMSIDGAGNLVKLTKKSL